MPVSKSRRKAVLVGGLLVVALAGGGAAIAATQPKPYTPTATDQQMMAKAEAMATTVEKERAERNAPPTLKPLPAHAKVLFFGDSWTRGRGADDPATQGYAPVLAGLMGWDAQVEGAGGTGYLNPGTGTQVPFTERAKTVAPRFAPDLIVLQGSQNDVSEDITKLTPAANSVVDTFRKRYPKAQLLMIGPGIKGADQVNLTLAQVAWNKGIPYVDEIGQAWVTGGNAEKYLLPDAHPNTAGHTYLATNLKAAIAKLTKP